QTGSAFLGRMWIVAIAAACMAWAVYGIFIRMVDGRGPQHRVSARFVEFASQVLFDNRSVMAHEAVLFLAAMDQQPALGPGLVRDMAILAGACGDCVRGFVCLHLRRFVHGDFRWRCCMR